MTIDTRLRAHYIFPMKQILATLALLMAMAIPAAAQMSVQPSCVPYSVTVEAFEEQGIAALVLRGEDFEEFKEGLEAQGLPPMPPAAVMAVVADPDGLDMAPTDAQLWVRIYNANGCHIGQAPVPTNVVRQALGTAA